MRKINSKVLGEVHAKYQVKFPNLAQSDNLLTIIYDQFKTRKKPKFIVSQKRLNDPKDYDCKSSGRNGSEYAKAFKKLLN